MKTFDEIEQQYESIMLRMEVIMHEISEGIEIDRSFEIARELSFLINESKRLKMNIKEFQKMARQLLICDCSGPH